MHRVALVSTVRCVVSVSIYFYWRLEIKIKNNFGYVLTIIKVTVSENDDFLIGGAHDLDEGWIKEVRRHGAKIVPRLLFDK